MFVICKKLTKKGYTWTLLERILSSTIDTVIKIQWLLKWYTHNMCVHIPQYKNESSIWQSKLLIDLKASRKSPNIEIIKQTTLTMILDQVHEF